MTETFDHNDKALLLKTDDDNGIYCNSSSTRFTSHGVITTFDIVKKRISRKFHCFFLIFCTRYSVNVVQTRYNSQVEGEKNQCVLALCYNVHKNTRKKPTSL